MRLITSKRERSGHSLARYLLWETANSGLIESSILYLHGRNVPWVFCLPSSAGCRQGCLICAMPQDNSPNLLDKHELWEIFEYSRMQVGGLGMFQVSFMGQGEPLLNRKNIFGFCADLCKSFPEATIGISTVGIAEGIRAMSFEKWAEQVKLQLSLHWWPPDKRKQIIPSEKEYPAEKALLESARFAKKWGKKCSLNCVLLRGINDGVDDAQQIAKIAANGPFYVKISEFNPHENCIYSAATEKQITKYCETIMENDVVVHRFRSIGTSIGAGCGQTKLSHERICTI